MIITIWPGLNKVRRRAKLADGCRHVYLDVGSNIGVQIRKLFEGDKYPNSPVLPVYDMLFGPLESRQRPGKVCAFGFEANPVHLPRIQWLEHCYSNIKGWRSKVFIPFAVSDRDDQTVTLYSDSSAEFSYWASNINRPDITAKQYRVKTIDLSRFIKEEIRGRLIPDEEVDDFPPSVYVKFDIEGSEYDSLLSLKRSKTLCDVHYATIEWHPSAISNKTWAEEVRYDIERIARAEWWEEGQCDSFTLDDMDDEFYFRDGMEWPDECLHSD